MPHRILCVFGTRPEAIKFAPVIAELSRHGNVVKGVTVFTSQHTDLAEATLRVFGIACDHVISSSRESGNLNQLMATISASLDQVLNQERASFVLVQGDTTTALTAAMAAFNRQVPVAHIEAGLRSGDPASPFPEEMNRRLITQIASLHFAATPFNVSTLASEGVPRDRIILTGNPVVDAMKTILSTTRPSDLIRSILAEAAGRDIILLTTHRRESFAGNLHRNLQVFREFLARYPRYVLCFPVHPNPIVRGAAQQILEQQPNAMLIDPLSYSDFLHLMRRAALIVSDSGGVQEEAPTLGRPLMILRDTTERPEVVAAGVAHLVGGDPRDLARLLEEFATNDTWARSVRRIENPFGRGDAAKLIVQSLISFLQSGAPTDRSVHAR